MRIEIASVDSIIIYFKNEISKVESLKVKNLYEKLKKLKGLKEIVPSYNSILITYDLFLYDEKTLFEKIKLLEREKNDYTNKKNKLFEIPVYYAEEVGADLQRIARNSKLSIQEVINLHTYRTYTVFAIGFAPGFAYLGSVDKKIAMKRLKIPRKRVPKGAVAIADTQTAIYPNESPGGWNIIGRTTFNLYDKSLDNLCAFNIADDIKFVSISKDEFLNSGGII